MHIKKKKRKKIIQEASGSELWFAGLAWLISLHSVSDV